jgi:hypothetical protein
MRIRIPGVSDVLTVLLGPQPEPEPEPEPWSKPCMDGWDQPEPEREAEL